MLSADFAAGHLLTAEDIEQKPYLMRFMSEAARLLSPVL
jgi:hypothetical protein